MIRIGIIGAGIGAQHMDGYRALPDRFRVMAMCDLDLARAAHATGGAAGIRVTADFLTLLQDPDIDLIDICLPPHLHAISCVRALEAGKHVICEKPLARSMAEVDAIAAAVTATGRHVFPVFQYRYGPAFAALDEMAAAGLSGDPLAASLETHWNRGADYYAVPWRGTWSGEAGGAVLGHAIHAHDLLCRYFGPVETVQARLTTRANPIETDDCAAIAFGFANGAVATSSVTLGAASDETRLRFVFRDLTATSATVPYAPATGTWRFTARNPARQPEVDRIVARHAGAPAGFAGYLAAVADALDGRATNAVQLQDGRASVELVTAIYAAARGDAAVRLPIDRDHPMWDGWQPEAPR